MHPPTKDQADIDIENQILDASASPENPDLARQEYKNEADINYTLSRFGITNTRGTPIYGETNDSLDLQMALESTRDAKAAFAQLDPQIQKRFGNVNTLLDAVENGDFVISQDKAPEETPTVPN